MLKNKLNKLRQLDPQHSAPQMKNFIKIQNKVKVKKKGGGTGTEPVLPINRGKS